MADLKSFLDKPSQAIKLAVDLCTILASQTTGLTRVAGSLHHPEPKHTYSKVLELYTPISEGDPNALKFLRRSYEILGSFTRFTILSLMNQTHIVSELRRDNIDDDRIFLNFEVFIFFLLIHEFEQVREAYLEAASSWSTVSESLLFQDAIQTVVKSLCPFQSNLDKKEFEKVVSLYIAHIQNPRGRSSDIDDY